MQKLFLLVCFLLAPVVANAASESFGNYTVYYQAVNSTFLDADIAEQYGITRSDRRAFLNISVMEAQPDGRTRAVSAAVSGGIRNLLGQVGNISFREIQEENSIYYIGEFEFSNAEIVRFSVNVQPAGETASRNIQWETRLYSN